MRAGMDDLNTLPPEIEAALTSYDNAQMRFTWFGFEPKVAANWDAERAAFRALLAALVRDGGLARPHPTVPGNVDYK